MIEKLKVRETRKHSTPGNAHARICEGAGREREEEGQGRGKEGMEGKRREKRSRYQC